MLVLGEGFFIYLRSIHGSSRLLLSVLLDHAEFQVLSLRSVSLQKALKSPETLSKILCPVVTPTI